jgi:hypothetical protein
MCAAAVQVVGVVVLGVQSVGGDDRVGDADPVQQRGERGDLVRLAVDHGLAQHDPAAGVERREQVHRTPIGATGTAGGLAVHRDNRWRRTDRRRVGS